MFDILNSQKLNDSMHCSVDNYALQTNFFFVVPQTEMMYTKDKMCLERLQRGKSDK